MSEEFGESQPCQHREGGHLQLDGPAGLGVVESGVGHPQAYGHAQTHGQGGLQSPSIEHHRHATPPSSFPQSVSSIGTYETSGTVVTQGPASRHTSTSQTWPGSLREHTRYQPGPEMNPTAQVRVGKFYDLPAIFIETWRWRRRGSPLTSHFTLPSE